MRLGAAAMAVTLLAGCGDSRLKSLQEGMDRGQALNAMGVVIGPDTANTYRSYGYLVDGKVYEILFFYPKGKGPADSVPDKELSPVVFTDGRLTGWGQAYWRPLARKIRAPLGPNTPPDLPPDSLKRQAPDSAAPAPAPGPGDSAGRVST